MAKITVGTTATGTVTLDPNKDIDAQIADFTPEMQEAIRANLMAESDKLQAEVDEFISTRIGDRDFDDLSDYEVAVLQFEALDNTDFARRAGELGNLGVDTDLVTEINTFAADPGDRPDGSTPPQTPPPDDETDVFAGGSQTFDETGGGDRSDILSNNFLTPGPGDSTPGPGTPDSGPNSLTGNREESPLTIAPGPNPDGADAEFSRADLIRQNFNPSFGTVINDRLGGLSGSPELDPAIGAPPGTTERDLILRAFDPSFRSIIDNQTGGLAGVGGPADRLLQGNQQLGDFNTQTGQSNLRQDLEGLVTSRLGDPGLPELDAATSEQLDALRAGEESAIETQFQDDRQSLLENLFGRNLQESTIATDQTGRMLFGRDQLSAEAAARDAQRRLDVRSGVAERNIQQTGLAGQILSDVFGTEIQRGLGEAKLQQGERTDVRQLLEIAEQLRLDTAGQQAGILQTGAELGLDERRVNVLQDDLVQRILGTAGELSLGERDLEIRRELEGRSLDIQRELEGRSLDIRRELEGRSLDIQREDSLSRARAAEQQVELERFLGELQNAVQNRQLDVETLLGTEAFKNNLEVAKIQAQAGKPGALQQILGTIGAVAGFFSSLEFKVDIEPEDSSEKLMALNPVTYQYDPEANLGAPGTQHGLIAEEVEKLFPEIVARGTTGKPYGIHYFSLIGPMLAEIQKLRRELDELKGGK